MKRIKRYYPDEMDNIPLFVIIGFAFAAIAAFALWKFMEAEKKKKAQIRDSFKSFSERKSLQKTDLRSVPRLKIPELLNIDLTLTDEAYFGLRATAIDISESGFSVLPDFPLRKLPVDTELNNVLIKTPLNNFVIDKMKTVRYEHEIKKRVLAFKILAIDGSQKKKQRIFMAYLDKFLKDEDSR